MIKVSNVTKKLDDYAALSDLSCEIPKGSVFGLIGSKGAYIYRQTLKALIL